MKNKLCSVLIAVLLLSSSIAPALAQDAGTATIIVNNMTSGEYTFLFVGPGSAVIAASAHGFQKETKTGPAGLYSYKLTASDGFQFNGHVTIPAGGTVELNLTEVNSRPVLTTFATAPTTATPASTTGAVTSYTVMPGDSVAKIARRLGVTSEFLIAVNRLGSGSVLTPGQVLRTDVYTVRSGDTLRSIATRLGVSVNGLAAANNMTDLNRLSIGQVLRLP